MKQETKERIYRNVIKGCANTCIGRYAYGIHAYTGEIMRCKRGDEEREWISDDGERHSAWEHTGEYI